MSGADLLPCPFCGGTMTHNNLRLARCKTPGCYMHNFVVDLDDAGSVSRWNTRAPDARVTALVKAAQWARNRLEAIADESWKGDARDFKRSLIGVFADFDEALAVCGSESALAAMKEGGQ